MANGSRPDATADSGAGGLHDRDIDPLADPRGARRRRREGSPRHLCQRLIANPFLAVLGLIVWFGVIRLTVQARRLDFFLPAAAGVSLVAFLFEYHCVDCGRTGRLIRWRDHACERVEVRRLSVRPARCHWPSPVTQTVLWVGAVLILYLLTVATN